MVLHAPKLCACIVLYTPDPLCMHPCASAAHSRPLCVHNHEKQCSTLKPLCLLCTLKTPCASIVLHIPNHCAHTNVQISAAHPRPLVLALCYTHQALVHAPLCKCCSPAPRACTTMQVLHPPDPCAYFARSRPFVPALCCTSPSLVHSPLYETHDIAPRAAAALCTCTPLFIHTSRTHVSPPPLHTYALSLVPPVHRAPGLYLVAMPVLCWRASHLAPVPATQGPQYRGVNGGSVLHGAGGGAPGEPWRFHTRPV